ncbi:MAG TPA: tetratricopeptide repeat protein [Geobacteraceae bacterium]|nr:tetratricopeptide repeat protein [Geobacteraceae bacterium]
MSSKKEKFLESAQKFIVKGQLDRAIKDYEQVVALDPNDIRHRQRLAELLVRVNRTLEAIGEYEAIGKYYADNGFYLKAIAVYKQVQKLDPDDIKTCLNLAVLNEKQGLSGNALTEYGKAFSYFDKGGKREDALKILETMIAIDPENLNTRLKFAETRFSMGLKKQAYDDFSQIALLLKKGGDESAFNQVSDRIRYLFPDKKDFTLELLASQVKSGDAAAALPPLQDITKKEQANLTAWNLLLEAYRATGAREEAKLALQKMVRIFPDDLGVKEGLIQTALDEGDIEGALYLLKLHSMVFADKGELRVLERMYCGLLELAPHDARVLQGLKKLYEASDNRGKIAEIDERLDSLSRIGAPTQPEYREEEVSASGEPAFPAEEETGLRQEEEEIPLSLSDEEETTVPEDLECAAEAEARGDVAEEELCIEAEPEYPAEIDLELEISDDGFADLVESAGQGRADEHETAVSAETEEEPAGAESLLSAGPDMFGAETVLAAEDEFVELELGELSESDMDFLSEIEAREAGPVPGPDTSVSAETEEEPAGAESVLSAGPDMLGEETVLAAEDEFVELELGELSESDMDFLPEIEAGEARPVPGPDKYSPDGLFSVFKKGLDQQLDQGDTETHYNLGIAFKEMGLYEEAITEFEAAALDPQRRIDCMTLQGVCCRDKGDYERAEALFNTVIGQEGLSTEEILSIKYELALLYESAGRNEDALETYLQIQAVLSDFRDTKGNIARLQGEEAAYDLDLIELENDEH